MKTTFEEYAKDHKFDCIKRSALERIASKHDIDINTLIKKYSNKSITIVMWA